MSKQIDGAAGRWANTTSPLATAEEDRHGRSGFVFPDEPITVGDRSNTDKLLDAQADHSAFWVTQYP